MSDPHVVVHTTPPLAPLPASDADSLRLICTLRVAGVSAGIKTAEWAANGKPFVTVDRAPVSSANFDRIPGYVNPDLDLSDSERADALSWVAYIEGQVSDLVNHTLYSLPPNYPVLANAQLAALAFPMNHYVPQRLRSIVKSRLGSVGLWGLGGLHDSDAYDEDQKRLEDSFIVGPAGTKTPRAWSGWRSGREAAERSRRFGEEALSKRARAAFDPLVRKLGRDSFFFRSGKPTSLDIALFSQLTLVLSTDLPNPLLSELLRSTYPALVKHHDRVMKTVFPRGWDSLLRLTPPAQPGMVDSLLSSLPAWLGGRPETDASEPKDEDAFEASERKTAADRARRLAWGRYAWYAGAGVAFFTYILVSGIVSFEFSGDDDSDGSDWDEDEEEEEEDEEEFAFSAAEVLARGSAVGGLPVWEDDEEPDGEDIEIVFVDEDGDELDLDDDEQ